MQTPSIKGHYKGTPTDPEYTAAAEKLADEIEYFAEKLSPEDGNRFAALIALYEDVHLMEKLQLYDHVFKDAVRMVLEIKKPKDAHLKLV